MASSVTVRRSLRRATFIISIVSLGLLIIVGIGSLLSAGWGSGISAFGSIALIFLFILSVITALATTEVIPWHELSWTLLQQPRVLGAIGAILISSFGTVGGFLQLLQDKGGTDAALSEISIQLSSIKQDTRATRVTTDAIKEDVASIGRGLEEKGIVAGKQTAIEAAINGVWGQSDCSNTYRFELSPAGRSERVLTVKSEKSQPGLQPYDGEYAFKSAQDVIGSDGFARSMLSTEETKGFEPGFAVDFTLIRSGSSEKLVWGSKSGDLNTTELTRCEG